MRSSQFNIGGRAWLTVALAFAAASTSAAQSRVVLPAGSVVVVRTMAPLQSANAQAGQTFETTVEQAVGVDEYTVIPSGSKIRGSITVARAATRDQSGVIEVIFDRLILADGTTFPLVGKLTSTDSAERRQIKANANARVVLVGGRGGLGAAIAGAGSGRTNNTLLSALGGLLSEGRDVDVPAGSPLAVELERAVTLRGRGRASMADGSTIFTSATRIREAQQALARLNYYRGSATGTLDDATRRALFAFQIDRGITGTGNLDGLTAQALGMDVSGTGDLALLTAEDASSVRREAQAIVGRYRSDIGITVSGQLNASRAYSQAELDLWFALSAFADNSEIYEQTVRGGANRDAVVLAGKSLLEASRRVEAAMPNGRASAMIQNTWATLRGRLAPLS